MQDFDEKVVVMAATNLPSALDDGLIGRFESKIHIRYHPLKNLYFYIYLSILLSKSILDWSYQLFWWVFLNTNYSYAGYDGTLVNKHYWNKVTLIG